MIRVSFAAGLVPLRPFGRFRQSPRSPRYARRIAVRGGAGTGGKEVEARAAGAKSGRRARGAGEAGKQAGEGASTASAKSGRGGGRKAG
jgi:hypothetical protein